MSQVQRLLQQLCPEGVEFVKLGDVGTFYGGLSGKTKDDFKEGNAKFLSYMNVYANPAIPETIEDMVKVGEAEKQNALQYGDILFTGSSETPDECGMSCVVDKPLEEKIYLNSFCFGFRFNDLTNICPGFLKHVFRSPVVRKAIGKTASGVTRYNVSKKRFAKIEIPLPPLPIQNEIVNILDKFTTLEAELEAELDCRKRQYQFYRDKLLSFKQVGGGTQQQITWKKMSEIAFFPKARVQTSTLTLDNYVGVENLLKDRLGKVPAASVPEGAAIEFVKDDILVGNIRPYLRKIWRADCNGGTNGDVLCFRIKEEAATEIIPDFLFQILSSEDFFNYDISRSRGAKMPRGDKAAVMQYLVPLPPLAEQRRIADILDRFERLTTDLQDGLPAEIQARRQQYEYYRNKLLTFKRKTA